MHIESASVVSLSVCLDNVCHPLLSVQRELRRELVSGCRDKQKKKNTKISEVKNVKKYTGKVGKMTNIRGKSGEISNERHGHKKDIFKYKVLNGKRKETYQEM